MKHRTWLTDPAYQVIQSPAGWERKCPICGATMEHTLVDDGLEVVLHYVCHNCHHGETLVRKLD